MSGSRPVPAALQAAIASRTAHLTMLLKIIPKVPGYASFGMTKLDSDITYDDGTGSLTYSAITGLVPANLSSSSTSTVGNTEFQTLTAAQFSAHIDLVALRAGAYDNAEYRIYVLDFTHPEWGHWEPPASRGIVGRQWINERGLSVTFELTDYTKLLKQAVVQNWSRMCRAKFGSQPFGTGGGVIEEEFPCGKNLATIWSATKTVTSAGAEPRRTFTASALGAAADTYKPGMIKWLTGLNAGRSEQVESQSGVGVISLLFPMPFAVQAGDTFQIRPGCTYVKDGNNGCKFHFASVSAVEWKNHYRGEPLTPVADGDSITTPGATW